MPLIVLLADLPQLLDDLVGSALDGASDVGVIRGGKTGGDLGSAAHAAGADVVVVARKDPTDLAAIDPRMASLAGLSVLALTPDGDAAWLHRCRCEAARLGELSATSVLAAVRAAAGTS